MVSRPDGGPDSWQSWADKEKRRPTLLGQLSERANQKSTHHPGPLEPHLVPDIVDNADADA